MQERELEVARRTFDERVRLDLKSKRLTAWTQHPVVREIHILPLMSGRPDQNWIGAARERYFQRPVDRGLSIGCGPGDLERYALRFDLVRHMDAYDLSPTSIETAQRKAAEAGVGDRVDYRVANLNEQTFPAATYDVVFACQSLHHIAALEHVYDQVHAALKPDGLFIINEYVGPNQLQWTDAQLEHARAAFARIPERYRTNLHSGAIKLGVHRQPIETMNRVDPTEGVRSADILPLLYERFDVVERHDYGGTVVNLVLEGIAGNFTDTPEDRAILQELCALERRLLDSGELPSDHTWLAARRKDAPR
ncbi:MAG: class I SAM-dependent methyltransferase [Planctomycetota bacterium]